MRTSSLTLRSMKQRRLSTWSRSNAIKTHQPTRNGWKLSNKVWCHTYSLSLTHTHSHTHTHILTLLLKCNNCQSDLQAPPNFAINF